MPQQPTYPPPPPPPDGGASGSERSGEKPSRRPSERPAFERIVPELFKRGLEVGRGTLEKNLPRDVAAQLAGHIGDLRQGVVAAVAQEVGHFLREADIAAEIRQVMTGLEIEAKVHLSFRESKSGGLETDVQVDGRPRRSRRARARAGKSSKPPPPTPESDADGDADDGSDDDR